MRQHNDATGKITHDTVALTTKSIHLVKRYGKRNNDGSYIMHMTHKTFGIAFEGVTDLAEVVRVCDGAFDRLRFHVTPQRVTVTYA